MWKWPRLDMPDSWSRRAPTLDPGSKKLHTFWRLFNIFTSNIKLFWWLEMFWLKFPQFFFGGWSQMLGFLKISIMFRTELFTFLQTMEFRGSEQTALSWKQWDCKRWRDAKIVSTHIYIYIYQERKMFLSSRCCKESSSCWCLDLFAFSKQTRNWEM